LRGSRAGGIADEIAQELESETDDWNAARLLRELRVKCSKLGSDEVESWLMGQVLAAGHFPRANALHNNGTILTRLRLPQRDNRPIDYIKIHQ
jgi:hypothetical protein